MMTRPQIAAELATLNSAGAALREELSRATDIDTRLVVLESIAKHQQRVNEALAELAKLHASEGRK